MKPLIKKRWVSAPSVAVDLFFREDDGYYYRVSECGRLSLDRHFVCGPEVPLGDALVIMQEILDDPTQFTLPMRVEYYVEPFTQGSSE